MATKLQMYSELADVSAKRLTASRKQWTDFLTTSARLYKYPYNEQLMIFAQRPDATACAPLEMWNKPMNRLVKRGSKGIALIDDANGKPRLKYVFDLSDTEDGRQNAKRPFVWELRQEHQVPVMDALTKTYGDMEGGLPELFHNIASQLAMEYYDDNAHEIGYSTEGSFLEEYDKFNVSVAFREALTVSVTYSLMSRCGLDPMEYLTDEDFQCIFDFNTPQSVYAIGTAVILKTS